MSNAPLLSPELPEQLLAHFSRLNDVGQQLALVLLQALAGNPALQSHEEPQPPHTP